MSGFASHSSPTFRACVHDRKNDQRYYASKEQYGPGQILVKRVVIYSGCGVTLADVHQGALSALFAACLIIVGLLQVGIYRRQAGLMRESIDGQTRDMGLYIAEAARAATAMEGVAVSMAANVEKLTVTVATNKEIAGRQKLFGEMQMRAYVSVAVGNFYDQDREHNAFMQIHPLVQNTGNTPAHEMRYRGRVVVRPFPPGPNFDFTLPPENPEHSATVLGAHQPTTIPIHATQFYSDEEIAVFREGISFRVYCFGTVNYKDAFGTEHYSNFCYSTIWSVQGKPVGLWTRHHNDSN